MAKRKRRLSYDEVVRSPSISRNPQGEPLPGNVVPTRVKHRQQIQIAADSHRGLIDINGGSERKRKKRNKRRQCLQRAQIQYRIRALPVLSEHGVPMMEMTMKADREDTGVESLCVIKAQILPTGRANAPERSLDLVCQRRIQTWITRPARQRNSFFHSVGTPCDADLDFVRNAIVAPADPSLFGAIASIQEQRCADACCGKNGTREFHDIRIAVIERDGDTGPALRREQPIMQAHHRKSAQKPIQRGSKLGQRSRAPVGIRIPAIVVDDVVVVEHVETVAMQPSIEDDRLEQTSERQRPIPQKRRRSRTDRPASFRKRYAPANLPRATNFSQNCLTAGQRNFDNDSATSSESSGHSA